MASCHSPTPGIPVLCQAACVVLQSLNTLGIALQHKPQRHIMSVATIERPLKNGLEMQLVQPLLVQRCPEVASDASTLEIICRLREINDQDQISAGMCIF